MKTLLTLVLVLILTASCNSVPAERVSSGGNNLSATVTATETIMPSATSPSIPSEIPTHTNTVSPTPSLTPFPSPTLPPDCGTTKLGKSGTQTKVGNHSVLVEGTAILCNQGSLFEEFPTVLPLREAMLDLDSGVSTVEAADLGFSVGGTMRFYSIIPINNAVGTLWSLSGLTNELPPQPTFEQCKEQVNLFNNDNVSLYVCVITSEGHIARVKFEKTDPVQQISSVEISFITWEEQVEKP